MQEDGGRQDASGDIPPIDHLVEGVELAGEVETGKDKRSQAENVKVYRAWRADPAIVYEQSNQQVDYANHILVVHRAVDDGLAHDYVRGELYVAAADQILGLVPNDRVLEGFSDIGRGINRGSGDLHQDVAIADSGIFGFAAGGDMQG